MHMDNYEDIMNEPKNWQPILDEGVQAILDINDYRNRLEHVTASIRELHSRLYTLAANARITGICGFELGWALTRIEAVNRNMEELFREAKQKLERHEKRKEEEEAAQKKEEKEEIDESLRLRAAEDATLQGEPVYLVTKPKSGMEQSRNLVYWTPESMADAYEKKNGLLILPKT